MKKKQFKKLKKIFFIGILFLIIVLSLFIINKINKNKQTTKTEAAPARIIGGVDANIIEFPYMAVLFITDNGGVKSCGGTLIKNKYVLTAAHCIHDTNNKILKLNDIRIFFSKTNINDIINGKDSNYYSAKKFYTKNFNKSDLEINDIAIIELYTKPRNIPSVTLVTKNQELFYKLGNNITAIGYGANQIYNKFGEKIDLTDNNTYTAIYEFKLKKITLPITKLPNYLQEFNTEFMGVGFTDEKSLLKTVIINDSGSPILIKEKGHFGYKYYQIGIVLGGRKDFLPENTQATKIINYLDFIEEVTGQN